MTFAKNIVKNIANACVFNLQQQERESLRKSETQKWQGGSKLLSALVLHFVRVFDGFPLWTMPLGICTPRIGKSAQPVSGVC